jgi:hypothetical protein
MATFPRFLAASMAAITFAAVDGSATVIWSDDFTGEAEGAFPSRDFNGNASPDWTATSTQAAYSVSTAVGAPAPAMVFNDTATVSQGVLRLEMDEFSSFTTAEIATPILRVSFDWSVETFLSNATNEAFRVILRANNSMAANNQIVLGFNRADLNDGDASGGDLTFFAASPNNTSNVTANDSTAIGLLPGLGWAPGFDFGQYDTVSGSDNDSDDVFYRFELSYDYSTGFLDGVATRIASDGTNGQSATFTRVLNAGLEFTNTDPGDVLLIASTNSVVGQSRFDNFLFESVPEPSAAAAMILGLLPLAGRRRRCRSSAFQRIE